MTAWLSKSSYKYKQRLGKVLKTSSASNFAIHAIRPYIHLDCGTSDNTLYTSTTNRLHLCVDGLDSWQSKVEGVSTKTNDDSV